MHLFKVGFQLPGFCIFSKFFAKEHWGEKIKIKIKRVNFRHTRKVKHNTTFFPAKSAQTENAKVSMLETGF